MKSDAILSRMWIIFSGNRSMLSMPPSRKSLPRHFGYHYCRNLRACIQGQEEKECDHIHITFLQYIVVIVLFVTVADLLLFLNYKLNFKLA